MQKKTHLPIFQTSSMLRTNKNTIVSWIWCEEHIVVKIKKKHVDRSCLLISETFSANFNTIQVKNIKKSDRLKYYSCKISKIYNF